MLTDNEKSSLETLFRTLSTQAEITSRAMRLGDAEIIREELHNVTARMRDVSVEVNNIYLNHFNKNEKAFV